MISQCNTIKISWPKAKEIMLCLGEYDKLTDPIKDFQWEQIGLEKIDINLVAGWSFNVLNKEKLIYAMLKYNFTLHYE